MGLAYTVASFIFDRLNLWFLLMALARIFVVSP